MKMTQWLCRAAVVYWLAIPTSAPLVTASQGSPAGAILEIHGPAYLRVREEGPAIRLEPRRDVMRRLYLGQGLRVGAGGRLKVALDTGIREIGTSDSWFVLQPSVALTAEQSRVAEALREYGRPGGSRGGAVDSLIAPANGSVIRLGRSIVRWRSASMNGSVAFRLEAGTGRVLWRVDGIDARLEALDSKTFQTALLDWNESGGSGTLILTVTGSDGSTGEAAFSILSREDEKHSESDLSGWERVGDKKLAAIGRAYECRRRGLRGEEIEELETALALAPESEELLSLLSETHRRYGDSARAAALKKKGAALVR